MSSFTLPHLGVHFNDNEITTEGVQATATQAATQALAQARQGGDQFSQAMADGYAQAQSALHDGAVTLHQQALPALTQIDALLQSEAPTLDSVLAPVVDTIEPLHGNFHATLVGSTVGAPADSLLATIGQAASEASGGQSAAGFQALRDAVHTATDGQVSLAVNGSGGDLTHAVSSLMSGLTAAGTEAANGNIELGTAGLGQALPSLPLGLASASVTAGGETHSLSDGAAPVLALVGSATGVDSPLASNVYLHAGPAVAPVHMVADSLSELHAPALPSITSLTDPANLPSLPPLPGH